MIRYEFQRASVEAEVLAADARWFRKAQLRTSRFVSAGKFAEKSSIWSTVKPSYMRLQKNKCIFCERQFENPDYGTIEFDLEHFRPKSRVSIWPDATRHAHLNYPFATGADFQPGYFWLAYSLENYAASCKVCNSTFKLNYFPVSAARATSPTDDLQAEQPYLCYPLGDADVDPASLVSFVATTAVPVLTTEASRRRGQVIIDFFGLNSRLQLHRERARMISLFGAALAARHGGSPSPADQELLSKLHSPALPHANCLRAHESTWTTNPALASRIYQTCRGYAVSDSQAAPPDI